jgi:hypothetical protein
VQGAGLLEPEKKVAGRRGMARALRGMARDGAGLSVELGAGCLQGHGSPEREKKGLPDGGRDESQSIDP